MQLIHTLNLYKKTNRLIKLYVFSDSSKDVVYDFLLEPRLGSSWDKIFMLCSVVIVSLSLFHQQKKKSKFGFTYYKDIYHFIYSLFLFILYKILYRENRFLTYTIQ